MIMNKSEEFVQSRLFELQDLGYRDFHSRLMPTVDKELIIGVRTPDLRKFAKDFAKSEHCEEFLKKLPHNYYEENNLHAFLIELIKDYDLCIAEVNRFLPFVDNWATCDMMRPKVFKKHLPELLEQIKIWLKSDDVYTLRFGIEMLMCHCLDGNFSEEYPRWVSEIKSDEYYVRMMVAWYFATALSKQYEAVIPYLEKKKLDSDTHKKAIRKALESYRIPDDKKAYLRTL